MSKHFTYAELLHSDTAEKKGIKNIPEDIDIYMNLHILATWVLEPLRSSMQNIPIYVNSGFRSAEVNALVGGVPNSLHLQGKAVDITAKDAGLNAAIYNKLSATKKACPCLIRELIWEGGGEWVHVAI